MVNNYWLVVTGTMEFGLTFPSYWEYIIIPTDELHHFSDGLKPPSKYIYIYGSFLLANEVRWTLFLCNVVKTPFLLIDHPFYHHK